MTYSVEDWSTFKKQEMNGVKLIIRRCTFAVLDLDCPVLNMDGETEFELLATCPTEAKAVRLVHLLNRTQ